jgi:hypothetical protein
MQLSRIPGLHIFQMTNVQTWHSDAGPNKIKYTHCVSFDEKNSLQQIYSVSFDVEIPLQQKSGHKTKNW